MWDTRTYNFWFHHWGSVDSGIKYDLVTVTLLRMLAGNVNYMTDHLVIKQVCFPGECVPPALVAATRCQYQGEYEVTSCLVPCSFKGVWGHFLSVPMFLPGGSANRGICFQEVAIHPYEQTNKCKNITLSQLRRRAVKIARRFHKIFCSP